MRSAAVLVLGMALFLVGPGVCADRPTTGPQVVEPLNPGVEQRVEPVNAEQEQHVAEVHQTAEQGVGPHVPPTPQEKRVSQVGKFLVGVTAAALAIGVMIAQLVFI